MGAAKIFETFFAIEDGERKPLGVEYKYGKNDTILCRAYAGDVWWIYELIECRTNLRDKEITYIFGEFLGIQKEK